MMPQWKYDQMAASYWREVGERTGALLAKGYGDIDSRRMARHEIDVERGRQRHPFRAGEYFGTEEAP